MSDNYNFNINIGADTSDFDRGAAEVEAEKNKLESEGVRVPIAISEDMRGQLKELQYSTEQIGRMTPTQAWDSITNKITGSSFAARQLSQEIEKVNQLSNEEVKGFDARTLQFHQSGQALSQRKEEIWRQENPQAAPLSEAPMQEFAKGTSLADGLLKSFNGDVELTKEALIGLGYTSKEAKDALSELVKEESKSSLSSAPSTNTNQTGLSRITETDQPVAGSLEVLRGKLQDARNAFDGSEASVLRLKDAQKEYNEVLNGANEALGKTGSAYNSMGSIFERQITRIAIGLAVWTTLRTVQQEIQQTIQAMQEYSVEVARFAANTDQSIGDATQQYNQLQEAAAMRGFTPTQAAPGIQQAARFTKNPEQQQELFGAAAQLSEALGLKDTTQATEALGSAMLATGKSAKELANLVYTGFKEMGGDPQQFMTVLTSVQALADETGGNFEKMFAAVAKGAETSGRSMDTSYQTLNKFAQNINSLSGDKFIQFVQQMQSVANINPLNSNSTLQSVDTILTEISAKWDSYSPEIQSKIIDILGGGKMRGTMAAAGVALMDSYGKGMSGEVANALDKTTSQIDDSFGQIEKRRQAIIAGMRTGGNVSGATLSDVSGGINTFLGSLFGGEKGGRNAAFFSEIDALVTQKGTQGGISAKKQSVLDQVMGLSPADKQKAIDEYNQMVEDVFRNADYTGFGGRKGYVDALKITAADQQQIAASAASAGQAAGTAYADSFNSATKSVFGDHPIGYDTRSPQQAAAQQSPTQKRIAIGGTGWADGGTSNATPENQDASTPVGALRLKLQRYAQNPTSEQFPLTTSTTDLTKMSQEEINAAKKLSVEISNQELASIREEMTMLGIAPDLINAAVKAREDELNATTKLLQTQQGVNYETGKQVAYLEKAAAQLKEQEQAKKSDFQFQRLKNVDPSQFPELQARANMYNQFLSNIGSPEKNQNINLLLGENNVFKTMNVRMTALQLALEDLTKVEKAQLSGTWNLPSGATALVPISSLDIQRWNGGGGGGMSQDAINSLMNAFGTGQQPVTSATNNVKTSVDLARDSIVKAIFAAKGDPYDKIEAARAQRTPPPADRSYDPIEDLRSRSHAIPRSATDRGTTTPRGMEAGEKQPGYGPEMAKYMKDQYDQALMAGLLQKPANTGTDVSGGRSASAAASKIDLSIAPLPLKTTLNANVTLQVDGKVLAQAMYPLMYQMLVKMSSTLSSAGGSVGTLRS